MIYISCYFYIMVIVLVVAYYILPLRSRWIVLLFGSFAVYFVMYKTGWRIILATVLASYLMGILLERRGPKKKILLFFSILLVALPWWIIKNANYYLNYAHPQNVYRIIVPLGISFYTLQIIGYFIDIYKGKILSQKNPAKFTLFILFFPKIVQGPISRYEELFPQLIEGHKFNEEKIIKGIYLIIWGFFLKLVIADKAAIIINTIFDRYVILGGGYIWIAGVLYSVQLYTDFLACITISQGVAHLFGINLAENFARPYFSVSINEFWKRWHISLSNWLRDYVYIPLGGNKRGNMRRYANILIVFVVSGIWHGPGFKYIFWGLLHAIYQITERLTQPIRNHFYKLLQFNETAWIIKVSQRIITFLFVMVAWIIFRADSLEQGLKMIKSMITVFNPWIFFDGSLLNMGLCWQEWLVLLLAICFLAAVEKMQENRITICEKILILPFYLRVMICIAAILGIMTFGTYGFGFNSQEFIYGGF